MVIYDILKDVTSNEKEQTVSIWNSIDLLKIDGGLRIFQMKLSVFLYVLLLFFFWQVTLNIV